jgi:hypothetical protein
MMFGSESVNRRTFLGAIAVALASISRIDAGLGATPLRLLLVHGRGQQGLDPENLKATWITALKRGADKLGKSLPETVVTSFPYYGDVLDRLGREADIPLVDEVHARGTNVDNEFLVFQAQVAEAVRTASGVTDEQVDFEYGDNSKPKGPLNWQWVQAILRSVDKHGGGMSGTALEYFTRDVFLYTTKAGVRQEVDRIIANALTDEPTIVVGHSLGSIVAYSVLRSDPRTLRIPLYLTVGCPLGIRAIRDQFRPLRYPLPVKSWFNAFNKRDVVALYPLDRENFPVTPSIENYSDVKNSTDNRHGIIGYLDDQLIAKRLLDALGV